MNLSDLISAALTNPMTNAGDIVIGDTGGVPKRLAKGSDGQVIGYVGGMVTPATHTFYIGRGADGIFHNSRGILCRNKFVGGNDMIVFAVDNKVTGWGTVMQGGSLMSAIPDATAYEVGDNTPLGEGWDVVVAEDGTVTFVEPKP